MPDLAALRIEYEASGIDPADMADDPIDEFLAWFEEAVKAGVDQPNAFVLATVAQDGFPSARAVLMKDFGPDGVTFFTNLQSRKAQDIDHNEKVAGCFVWLQLHRQIRIEGRALPVDAERADAYFATRPGGSRLSAAVSPQSQVVESRELLDRRYRELEERFPDGDVPRPPHWGGFRIEPEVFEFWQGRPNRFHDRVRYRRGDGAWVKERLAP